MNFKEFINKLQNLPEKQKKIILWSIVAVLGLILGFIWFKMAIIRFAKIEESMKKIELPGIEIPNIQPTKMTVEEIKDQTVNWETYTNDKYGFEIKYPSDWVETKNIFSDDPDMVFCPSALQNTGEGCRTMLNAPSHNPVYESGVIYLYSYNKNFESNNENYFYLGLNSEKDAYYYLFIDDKNNKDIAQKIISTFKFIK